MSAPAVTPELRALLRRVKLGRCLDTLPERLALAQTGGMDTPSSSSSCSPMRSAAGRRPRPTAGPAPPVSMRP
jgi:hypothetical protein